MNTWQCGGCLYVWYLDEAQIPNECPECEDTHVSQIDVWECSECGAVWAVPLNTVPVECPSCHGSEIDKQYPKPGGNKPINWPGSWQG